MKTGDITLPFEDSGEGLLIRVTLSYDNTLQAKRVRHIPIRVLRADDFDPLHHSGLSVDTPLISHSDDSIGCGLRCKGSRAGLWSARVLSRVMLWGLASSVRVERPDLCQRDGLAHWLASPNVSVMD